MAVKAGSRKHHKKGGQVSCGSGTCDLTASIAGGKSRKHHKKGGSRRTVRRHVKKGGMLSALSGIVQTALVPFGIFAAQKLVQRGKEEKKEEKKERK